MRLSVVIVSYDSARFLPATLEAVRAQLEPGDEVIVVDNASRDGTAGVVAREAPWVRLERSPVNAGFAAACNRGAALARGELLLFLNPDAVPHAGALAAVRAGASRWEAFQGLVVGAEGVNSAGGQIHYLGIAWAAHGDAPAAPRAVGFASGACLAIARDRFSALGGFPERFFMYFEDVDLALRVRLAGGRVGIEPAAVFRHDYAFLKGADKWRRLERNRWWTVLRTYPAPLLAAVLPAMLALEVVLLVVAARGGWSGAKLRAMGEVARSLPRVWGERREVQSARTIPAAEFAAVLRDVVESPYVAAPGTVGRALLRWYGALVRRTSTAAGRPRSVLQ